jgi:adenine deaminase
MGEMDNMICPEMQIYRKKVSVRNMTCFNVSTAFTLRRLGICAPGHWELVKIRAEGWE